MTHDGKHEPKWLPRWSQVEALRLQGGNLGRLLAALSQVTRLSPSKETIALLGK